jgi:recombination protein RecR
VKLSPLIDRLVDALRCLPGVGPKSAQRMAFHLLERDREGARRLASTMLEAIEKVRHCERCRNVSEALLCDICCSDRRDSSLLCIVESPADVKSIESAAGYRGKYFVLMGRLSPLDGIGPAQLGLDRLPQLVAEQGVKEVILATGATAEGQATAHYVGEQLNGSGALVTRIAHGIPLGGELEYVDSNTLSHALASRRAL